MSFSKLDHHQVGHLDQASNRAHSLLLHGLSSIFQGALTFSTAAETTLHNQMSWIMIKTRTCGFADAKTTASYPATGRVFVRGTLEHLNQLLHL